MLEVPLQKGGSTRRVSESHVSTSISRWSLMDTLTSQSTPINLYQMTWEGYNNISKTDSKDDD